MYLAKGDGKLPKFKKERKRLSNIKIESSNWTLRPDILLCPNVPMPLHGMPPRKILGSKWWNETRKTAYASTNFHCQACGTPKHRVKGSRKHLEGHELYDTDYVAGTLTYVETVPLCPYCHNYIHDGRLEALLQKGQITRRKFAAVIQHGDEVLTRAGLTRPTKLERDEAIMKGVLSGEFAMWSEWRLVLHGETYEPKFKDEQEWKEYHA